MTTIVAMEPILCIKHWRKRTYADVTCENSFNVKTLQLCRVSWLFFWMTTISLESVYKYSQGVWFHARKPRGKLKTLKLRHSVLSRRFLQLDLKWAKLCEKCIVRQAIVVFHSITDFCFTLGITLNSMRSQYHGQILSFTEQLNLKLDVIGCE